MPQQNGRRKAISKNETVNPFRVGLTGGIACGKSTVAKMFADLGATIIDTDVIARTVVEPGQPATAELRNSFGDRVFDADGILDRKALRAIVFADDEKRRLLESILHPRIHEEVARQSAIAAGPYQVIVVPLLADSPMRYDMERILVVDCEEKVQLARLLERDSESIDQAKRMIDAQASREKRLAIADDIISSDASLKQTQEQVELMHTRYLAFAAVGAG
jgi:dephospho-CoA kinase